MSFIISPKAECAKYIQYLHTLAVIFQFTVTCISRCNYEWHKHFILDFCFKISDRNNEKQKHAEIISRTKWGWGIIFL